MLATLATYIDDFDKKKDVKNIFRVMFFSFDICVLVICVFFIGDVHILVSNRRMTDSCSDKETDIQIHSENNLCCRHINNYKQY